MTNDSLSDKLRKRADPVENWVPGTMVVPLDEILWEINQHAASVQNRPEFEQVKKTYSNNEHDHTALYECPTPDALKECLDRLRETFKANCNDKYSADEVNGKIKSLVEQAKHLVQIHFDTRPTSLSWLDGDEVVEETARRIVAHRFHPFCKEDIDEEYKFRKSYYDDIAKAAINAIKLLGKGKV